MTGNKLITAQFAPIGNSEGYDIQDIVASGADIETFVSLQTLTPSGKTDEMFSWDTWLFVDPGDEKWVDDKGIATRKIQPGEGLWVSGQNGYTLRIPAPNYGGDAE